MFVPCELDAGYDLTVVEPELQKDSQTGGFSLGDWWVNPVLGRVLGPEGERHVTPRAMDLLVFLAEHAGQVKSKDEILEAVWHDTVVADGVVFRHVSALRQLLGDTASHPRFIETIPKRGYRLIAPVGASEGALSAPGARHESVPDTVEAVRSAQMARRIIPWLITVGTLAVGILAIAVPWILASRTPQAVATDPALSRDPRAYKLFLDSLATSRDPGPNERAIELLRAAVKLDPAFVPAWESLSERLYLHGSYGGGGEATIDEADAAMRRASEIDPRSPGVLGRQVTLLTERGELAAAYELAKTLVREHPDRSMSHFALAYVYRYAGLLTEAAQECETALAIDPVSYRLRSCAIVFYRLGRFERAEEILRIDAGSEWTLHQQGLLDLHRRQPQATLANWRKLSQEPWITIPWAGMLASCLTTPHTPRTAINLRSSADKFRASRDPEAVYFGALLMSACNRPALALGLLEDAAARGYCTLSAFDSELAFNALRDLEDYAAARDAVARCSDDGGLIH